MTTPTKDIVETMALAARLTTGTPDWTWAKVVREVIAAAEKAGWVLVPKEPSQHMKDRSGTPRAADVWRMMLAAAPKVLP